ncbi:MAG: hypothetical protein NZ516_02540 [Raineya sp.]|nr:hypothetical protein [Raineya sp.]
MKERRSFSQKIRTTLLILISLGTFYWIYFVVLGFSPFKIEEANKIRRILSNFQNQPKEVISKTFHLSLLDSFQKEPILWNLASSYYQLGQKTIAFRFYDSLSHTTTLPLWQTKAQTQIGNIIFITTPQELDSALKFYKQALYFSENNENARYNYELLKKLSQKNTPPPNRQISNVPLPTPNDTATQIPIYKENKSSNELLEAINNQEQDLLRKYFQKKVPQNPTTKNLPAW